MSFAFQINRSSQSDQQEIQKTYTYRGLTFCLDHRVFSPKRNSSSVFLAGALREQTPSGSMIEVGVGCGLIGLSTLSICELDQLWATDANRYAVECTQRNSQLLGLGGRTSVYLGDVYDPLPTSTRASLIFWNTPWICTPPWKKPAEGVIPRLTRIHMSFCDPNYRALTKFIRGADQRLLPDGRLFIGFGKGGHMEALRRIASVSGYEVIERKTLKNHDSCVVGLYELARPSGKTCVELAGLIHC